MERWGERRRDHFQVIDSLLVCFVSAAADQHQPHLRERDLTFACVSAYECKCACVYMCMCVSLSFTHRLGIRVFCEEGVEGQQL